MLSTKIRTAAAIVTATFAVGVATGPLTADDAQAAPKAGTWTQTKPVQKKDGVSQLKSNPTGDAGLDNFCRQVADLINRSFKESFEAYLAGDGEGGAAWHDQAIELIKRGKARGCNFSLFRLVQANSRIPRGMVNSVR